MSIRYPIPLIFLTFLLLSVAVSFGNADSGTHADQWKAVLGKNEKANLLYDPFSVVPSGPRVFRVWIMVLDKDHSPRKSLEEFDCSNRIVRDIEVIVEKPNKPILHTFTPSEWRGIDRESPRWELFTILCR